MKALLLLPLLFANFSGDEEEKREVKLQGFDVLAAPGEKIELRAKLERKLPLKLRPNLHEQELIFKQGDKEIGRVKTADEGIASLAWTPPKDLNPPYQEFEFQVLLHENEKYADAKTKLRVFIRDPKKPALVLDIDGTICISKELDVPRKDPSELKCMEGSIEAVQTLAKDYDLIYLTARDEALINRSREWLSLNKFPNGPILFRDLGLFNLSAEKHKTELLKQLKKRFNLVAGIGDRDEDADAYLAAGIEAYLVGDGKKVPKGAKKLENWAEAVKLLKKS